jgi:hypothetical protein
MADQAKPADIAEALKLARRRLRNRLQQVGDLAWKGNIPAARTALADAESDLDDIQELLKETGGR